ncbi:hypothetical protein [Iningainema tapete]|uniref:Uncharacterized protein n=1 Tax=Iningainema tapete BLCC-T55 TaxID=2748662 RepID=A0A8J6XJJ6_9CYAN|nr:hypothetical protein [Iningainema tapete]MBD2773666.1 hypothetical protein [Iningainema tapete BLCC-T55]
MSPKTITNSRTQLAQKVPFRLILVVIYGEGSKFWFDLNLLEATGWIEIESLQQNVIGYQGENRQILMDL